MLVSARLRLTSLQLPSLFPPSQRISPPSQSLNSPFFQNSLSYSAPQNPKPPSKLNLSATKTPKSHASDSANFARTFLFIPPGVDPDELTDNMVLPSSNIVIGPYAGDSKIKQVEFVGSSVRPKDCPKDGRPEFAMLGRSNVGKSSLINSLVRKKEVALTSKKPGFYYLLWFVCVCVCVLKL